MSTVSMASKLFASLLVAASVSSVAAINDNRGVLNEDSAAVTTDPSFDAQRYNEGVNTSNANSGATDVDTRAANTNAGGTFDESSQLKPRY
ncbi:hypothetical protein N8I74_14145 [Chitiniphilus purpureus]|uniref:Uncharacterized protein n=1 Tax=Chitiniphilus purpureus TaxID=2981137 RepID=A0ABY6DJC9_9NEIS|nr:hypothetical protein [Chitiniphilus sp. CD1]UXY14450.1 hypothetical protein N8I74_14145 [Chitiniphilus sp. CD1]